MRITYYRFPEETPEAVLLEHGCGVLLKDGQEIYPESIPDERRAMVESIDRTISCRVAAAKKLMKQYGGAAWTEHVDRDGGCFEVTEVTLTGNNSRFKYNQHL